MVCPYKQNTSGKTSKQALLAKANGKKTVGQPRTWWINITLRILGGITWDLKSPEWNKSETNHPNKIIEMVQNCEVWWLDLELLPRNPHDGKVSYKKRERERERERERISLMLPMLSTVSLTSCIFTNFSFSLPASSLPVSFLIDTL